MIQVDKIVSVQIKGVADKKVSFDKCRPGLCLMQGQVCYTRGDGKYYDLKDGCMISYMKESSYGPDGPTYEYKDIYPIQI